MEEEKEDQDRGRKNHSGGVGGRGWGEGGGLSERSVKKPKERETALPVSELSLYSRPPLWSYSREQSTSLSDLACSHCPTHTHT